MKEKAVKRSLHLAPLENGYYCSVSGDGNVYMVEGRRAFQVIGQQRIPLRVVGDLCQVGEGFRLVVEGG